MIFTILFLLILLFFLALIFQFYRLRRNEPPDIPVYGGNIPIVGFLSLCYHGFSKTMRNARQYHETYYIDFGISHWLIVGDADFATMIWNNSSIRPDFLSKALKSQGIGDTLLTTNGDEWHFRRNMISPVFQASTLKNIFWIFTECAGTLVRKWEKGADKDGVCIANVTAEMKRLTLEVIGLAAFGIQFGGIETDSTNDILESIETILYGVTKVVGKGYPTFFNSSKIRQADKIVKKTVLDIIQKKLSKLEKGEVREKPDLLDSLLMESQKMWKENHLLTKILLLKLRFS